MPAETSGEVRRGAWTARRERGGRREAEAEGGENRQRHDQDECWRQWRRCGQSEVIGEQIAISAGGQRIAVARISGIGLQGRRPAERGGGNGNRI